jgi:hypothetical protein
MNDSWDMIYDTSVFGLFLSRWEQFMECKKELQYTVSQEVSFLILGRLVQSYSHATVE